MTVELILFLTLALVTIAAAIGMLVSKNAIYSAVFLVLVMSALAVIYLLLSAPFIAVVQITVYAGAIMVLFLFVIMLMGAEQLSEPEVLNWQRPLAYVLGAVLLLEAAYIFLFGGFELDSPGEVAEGFGGPEAVGLLLYQEYLLPFEAVSILLLASMVGAIVLTRRKNETS
jgi:NADH-quinone oxidoreductase subunit J